MKQLTILVPNGKTNLSSIAGSYKILSRADQHWQSRGYKPKFRIQLAGLSKKNELYDGLFSIRPHTLIGAVKKTDLIIIPSISHRDCEEVLEQNKTLIPWLKKQHAQGAEIASICTGAFILASSGLLDGKSCSTHWIAADLFSSMFPKVRLLTEKILTDEEGIYTNGGAFSFLNLILYLVEKFYDRETAIYCSKVFQVETDRNTQSPFMIFSGQKNHGDVLVARAQELIEQNLGAKLSFEQLASDFAVSRRNFDRRFTRATGNTPLEYWQRVKIEAAKKQLEGGRKSISEVMYEVGYTDTRAFREVFRKITGLLPVEYRNKYAVK